MALFKCRITINTDYFLFSPLFLYLTNKFRKIQVGMTKILSWIFNAKDRFEFFKNGSRLEVIKILPK